MTLNIEKLKQSAEHFKLNDCPILVNPLSLLELITRLEAAEASSKQWEESYHKEQQDRLDTVIALRERLEAAERDAERYRWLRASENDLTAEQLILNNCEDNLDEAIDIATKEKVCKHNYVIDQEAVRHKCCQKCGDVMKEKP